MSEASIWKPITIDSFQEGIAPSPALGFGDMRNINIGTFPGEATMNFGVEEMNLPPTVTAVSVTGVEATNVLTVADTTGWYNGMAIYFNSLTGGAGLATNTVYWVGSLSGTTFSVYTNPTLYAGNKVNFTTDLTAGTLTSYVLGRPIDRATFYSQVGNIIRPYIFILDHNGRAWWVNNTGGTITNNLSYLANSTLTGTNGRAIQVFSQDIVIFRETKVDRMSVADLEGGTPIVTFSWTYGFETISNTQNERRPTLVGRDNILYFDNDQRLGSFDDSYVYNASALDIPIDDSVVSIGELGQNILVGGLQNYIYPWNRIDSSFSYPVILPENSTYRIVTANQLAYLFVGGRGNIYVTNGSTVETFYKIPDYISTKVEPYYLWEDAIIWDGQLYFSFRSTENDGTTLDETAGVWSLQLTDKKFRHAHQPSYGTYAGYVPVLIGNAMTDTPAGSGIYMGWVNGSSYGVDAPSTSLATGYITRIDSAYLPVGTFLTPRTFKRIEVALDQPMTANQGVKLSYRLGLNDAFTAIGTFDGSNADYLAKYGFTTTANIQDAVNLQIRIEITTTADPIYIKYVRLI